MNTENIPSLIANNISKNFGGIRALNNVSITIMRGEIHGLLGENGSGKSTLIKILAGYHDPEPGGLLEVNGSRLELPLQPGQFRELGMGFVHQDLGLIPSLTVLENLRISAIASSKRWWHISWAHERRSAREALSRLGVEIPLNAKVASLRPVDRARLAIVRAIEDMRYGTAQSKLGPGVIFLDEPTAFLPGEETQELFMLIREIAAQGGSVVFVSHDLDEVCEITDRVTILRDGNVIGTVVTADTKYDELIRMIIGRRLDEVETLHTYFDDKSRGVSVVSLSGGAIEDATFDVYEGEVLGITGLIGSGFDEVPYRLFGVLPSSSGQIIVQDEAYDLSVLTPQAALKADIALLPGDRQNDGSVGSLTVGENVSLQVLDQYFNNLHLSNSRMFVDAKSILHQFGVRPNDPSMNYQQLSGGNQQKALIAKWFRTEPKLLLLHEPTRGVDVGARRQIFTIIRDAAKRGSCIICASSDFDEVIAICDRLLIFRRGRIRQQLTGDNITRDRVYEYSVGGM